MNDEKPLKSPAGSVSSGLTDTGRSLCSEARLTPAREAAGSVLAGVSQLAATQLLEAALVHVYRQEEPRTVKRQR